MLKSKHGYTHIIIIATIIGMGFIVTIKTTVKTVVKETPIVMMKQVKQYGIITTHMSERITQRAMLNGIKSIWIRQIFNTFSKNFTENITKQGITKGTYLFYAKAPNGRWIKIPVVIDNGKVIGKTFMVTSKKQGQRLNEKGIETFLEKAPNRIKKA